MKRLALGKNAELVLLEFDGEEGLYKKGDLLLFSDEEPTCLAHDVEEIKKWLLAQCDRD